MTNALADLLLVWTDAKLSVLPFASLILPCPTSKFIVGYQTRSFCGTNWDLESVRPRYRQKSSNRAGNGRNKNQLSHKHCWNIVRGKQLPHYNTAHFHLLIDRLSSFQKFALKLMSLWNYLLSYMFRRWHLDKFKKLLLSHFTDLYHFSTSQSYACIF